MYRIDAHIHTVISSACGALSPKEVVSYYKSLGYDGIVITDHFYLGNAPIDKSLPWEYWVHDYCNAYRETKREGDEQGLDVFFGWESTYNAEDFLIYGLDEEWLVRHPEIITLDQRGQYELVHAEGGFVIQAHPMRERTYMTEIKLHPYHCDAWEIANCGNQPYQDLLAKIYAEKYGLHVTAGSDTHKIYPGLPRFGIETERRITSIEDYCDIIRSGSGYRLYVPEDRFQCDPMNPYFEVYLYDENHERHHISREIIPNAPFAGYPVK